MISICFSRVRSCLSSILTYVNVIAHDNNSTKLSRHFMSSTIDCRYVQTDSKYICSNMFKVSWFLTVFYKYVHYNCCYKYELFSHFFFFYFRQTRQSNLKISSYVLIILRADSELYYALA